MPGTSFFSFWFLFFPSLFPCNLWLWNQWGCLTAGRKGATGIVPFNCKISLDFVVGIVYLLIMEPKSKSFRLKFEWPVYSSDPRAADDKLRETLLNDLLKAEAVALNLRLLFFPIPYNIQRHLN